MHNRMLISVSSLYSLDDRNTPHPSVTTVSSELSKCQLWGTVSPVETAALLPTPRVIKGAPVWSGSEACPHYEPGLKAFPCLLLIELNFGCVRPAGDTWGGTSLLLILYSVLLKVVGAGLDVISSLGSLQKAK